METLNRNQRLLEQKSLTATCEKIQWLIDKLEFSNDRLTVIGWAIFTKSKDIGAVEFRVNGVKFDTVNYPIASPDLHEIYWNVSNSANARFECSTSVKDIPAENGFYRLEFVQNGDNELSRKTAWFVPDPALELPWPEGSRIQRVIGTPDVTSYLLGGATTFGRFSDYLKSNFELSLNDVGKLLDWGCGSARVARYAQLIPDVDYWGVDIDPDNIKWCKENIRSGHFETIPIMPETNLPNASFDLIIGISVLTHLDEPSQFAWLKELKRISKPGGILMLSVQGYAQSGLYQAPEELLQKVEADGFVNNGRNPQLNDSLGENDHYLDVIQSRRYIREKWGGVFEVKDIVSALASNQDVVVMTNTL